MNPSEIRRINKEAVKSANGDLKSAEQCTFVWVLAVLLIYSLLVILQPACLMVNEKEFNYKKALLISSVIALLAPVLL